jgi:ribulose-5-phosphate 4-epimerase/fuculose-1-phosphate aldolase
MNNKHLVVGEQDMHNFSIKKFSAVRLQEDISPEEWATRVHLAAAFRMAFHKGWNRDVHNHITARVPGQPDCFLMNPVGLGWDEVTASSLVKVDTDGRIISHANVSLAPAGLNFHSGIMANRPDVNCVFHVHPTTGVVISATKSKLVMLHQTGCHIAGEVGYHDFEGLAQEEEEVPRILRDLGEKHLLLMWNHGLLSIGRTIGEAFLLIGWLIETCEIQERAMATGAELRPISEEVLAVTTAQMQKRIQTTDYSERNWQYQLRSAERLDPSFAT